MNNFIAMMAKTENFEPVLRNDRGQIVDVVTIELNSSTKEEAQKELANHLVLVDSFSFAPEQGQVPFAEQTKPIDNQNNTIQTFQAYSYKGGKPLLKMKQGYTIEQAFEDKAIWLYTQQEYEEEDPLSPTEIATLKKRIDESNEYRAIVKQMVQKPNQCPTLVNVDDLLNPNPVPIDGIRCYLSNHNHYTWGLSILPNLLQMYPAAETHFPMFYKIINAEPSVDGAEIVSKAIMITDYDEYHDAFSKWCVAKGHNIPARKENHQLVKKLLGGDYRSPTFVSYPSFERESQSTKLASGISGFIIWLKNSEYWEGVKWVMWRKYQHEEPELHAQWISQNKNWDDVFPFFILPEEYRNVDVQQLAMSNRNELLPFSFEQYDSIFTEWLNHQNS